MGTRFVLAASAAWFCCQAPVSAQAQADAAYDATYFAAFAPRTALDMVENTPGFTIQEGEERRGFAGAQSNVLIDGAPPAAKAEDIEDILARIPAADVVRIEVVRSGTGAGSAQNVRVNVVRRARGAGIWETSAERAADGRVSPGIEAAWSGRRGATTYGVSGSYDVWHAPIHGDRRDVDASGALIEQRDETIPSDEREAQLAAEAAFRVFGGAAALNAQLSRIEYDERESTRIRNGAGAAAGAAFGALAEREDIGEFAATWRREWGGWESAVGVVLTRRRYREDENTRESEADGDLDEAALQRQRIESGETILRLTAERGLPRDWRVELSAEGALNTLQQRLALFEDEGLGLAPVTLPSANVRVEETRAELAFLLAGPLAPRWRVEAGAAVEASRLTQRGDSAEEAELVYWKPSLQLTRALGDNNQLRLRLYRDVGQLDFEDFVSAADIRSSVVDAGNPQLRPQTSWRIEAGGDWRFGEDAALNVTIFRWAVEDALDIVPIGAPGAQFDAAGNIGDADVSGVRVVATAPLPLSAQLRLDGLLQSADASDPLTGERRSLSEFEESALNVGLRQDRQHWAWGLDYEREIEAPTFRFDRIERERDAEVLTLWAEFTAWSGLKLRAWVSNLADSAETRSRRQFDPDRTGMGDGGDERARREGTMAGVSLSGDF